MLITSEKEIIEYNKIAKGETLDPFGKTKYETAELNLNNIVAIDISLNAKLFPCPTLSLGGLSVNEKTGSVLIIEESLPLFQGLYAAGRNASRCCIVESMSAAYP